MTVVTTALLLIGWLLVVAILELVLIPHRIVLGALGGEQ